MKYRDTDHLSASVGNSVISLYINKVLFQKHYCGLEKTKFMRMMYLMVGAYNHMKVGMIL